MAFVINLSGLQFSSFIQRISLILFLVVWSSCSRQARTELVEWDKTVGGTDQDDLYALGQTTDGGYILGGSSWSGISGDKTSASRGENDFWVVKLDASGKIQWQNSFGGTSFDELKSLQQTSDGGYILGGYSYSPAGGDKTAENKGECKDGSCTADYWIVKLDEKGKLQWEKSYGGNGNEELSVISQTRDGGYILGGSSDSDIGGDKSEASRGETDYWVLKLDAAGHKVWDRTYGGDKQDYLRSLQQTDDGGFIVGGASSSSLSGDKSEENRGHCDEGYCSADFWVLKLDAAGNKQWDRTFGGSEDDNLNALLQTNDGGYVLGGGSFSSTSGDKTEDSRGDQDQWLVKVDANGNKIWDKTIGGNDYDTLLSLKQTDDDGFILGGWSSSDVSGDKTAVNMGTSDFWVVKLDASGQIQWDRSFGGEKGDHLYVLQQTSDGGFILGGSSESEKGGDKSEPSRGSSDFWVVKLSREISRQPLPAITLLPPFLI